MKKCRKCGLLKPITEFNRRNNIKSGRSSRCKSCIHEYYLKNKDKQIQSSKLWYQSNKKKRNKWVKDNYEHLKQLQKKSRDKLRLEVINNYGGKCACCGEERIEFLTIDHIGGGGSKHRETLGGSSIKLYRWLRKNNYPEGFRVLCWNCNESYGHYGYCPHQHN